MMAMQEEVETTIIHQRGIMTSNEKKQSVKTPISSHRQKRKQSVKTPIPVHRQENTESEGLIPILIGFVESMREFANRADEPWRTYLNKMINAFIVTAGAFIIILVIEILQAVVTSKPINLAESSYYNAIISIGLGAVSFVVFTIEEVFKKNRK